MFRTAISYTRFSSARQALGHSEERQIESARQYAKENGFVLKEIVDRGLSGYTGKNVSEGVLGDLIRQVKAGELPKNLVLLVEDPDRISRESWAKAYPKVYQPLTDAGIEIHFLSFRGILKPGHSFTDLLQIGIKHDQGHLESAKKSERCGKAWSAKRHNANGQKAMSAKVPAWLRAEKGHAITVIPERAKLIRQMYEWAAKGLGQYAIADKLITLGVPAWGPVFQGRPPRWTSAYVRDILASRAVLGEYQPMTRVEVRTDENGKEIRIKLDRRRPDGPLVKDYYPKVVPLSLWQKVQEVRTKFAQSKFGESLNAGKDKFSDKNLFRKLVFDVSNNAPMTYKAYAGYPCLVTTYRKDLRQHKIQYRAFENAMLEFLSEADWKAISRDSDTPQNKQLFDRQEQLAKEIEDNAEILKRYEAMIDNPDSRTFLRIRNKYKLAVEESERLLEERTALEAEIAASHHAHDILSSTSGKEFTPRDRTSKEARLKLRLLIAQRVSQIDIHFGETAKSIMGAEALATIHFVNGAERWLAFHHSLPVPVTIEIQDEEAASSLQRREFFRKMLQAKFSR